MITTITDFYEHVNREWIDNTKPPEGYPKWSCFSELDFQNIERLKLILSDDKQSLITDLYKLICDHKTRNEQGINPISKLRETLNSVKTKEEYFSYIGKINSGGRSGLFNLFVDADIKNSDINRLHLYFGSIFVPDRSYYLDDKFKNKVDGLRNNLIKMSDKYNLNWNVDGMLELDKKLALIQPTKEDKRNSEKYYYYLTRESFLNDMNNDLWNLYFNELTFHNSDFVVCSLSYFRNLTDIIVNTDLNVLLNYHERKIFGGFSGYLDDDLFDLMFEYSGMICGLSKPKEKWIREIETVDNLLGSEIGRIYVHKYFPESSKKDVVDMVKMILKEMEYSIDNIGWMSSDTKLKAKLKLSTFTTKIGYPDKFRDYSELILCENIVDTVLNINKFDANFSHNKINKKVDKTEWFMNAHDINAYYNPSFNEIVFPAGIMQSPFYDSSSSLAKNIGGLGSVIAHEITHGFDDQGAKYDENGVLNSWWKDDDLEKFNCLTKKLKEQFDNYKFHDKNINGGLTLGENIADLGGVTLTLRALIRSGNDSKEVLHAFFASWATIWRNIIKEDYAHMLLEIDPHSPGKFRANIVNNLDEYYNVFDVDDSGVVPKEDRVVIW